MESTRKITKTIADLIFQLTPLFKEQHKEVSIIHSQIIKITHHLTQLTSKIID